MRVVQGALDIIDRRVWHSASFENFKPLLRSLRLGYVLDHAINLFPVLHTEVICYKTRVRLPFGVTQAVAQDPKELIIATSKHDISVLGLETTVWDNRR